MIAWFLSVDADQWFGFAGLMVIAVCVGLSKRYLDSEGGE